jgi:eukaryotic-like serine/threonine-protein kinase
MNPEAEKWTQVKELFETALAVEQSLRHRFLERECSSTESRDAVEKLLAAHEEAGSFLRDDLKFVDLSYPTAVENCLAPGSVLVDRFRILRFISRGGMGEVYEALDLELDSHIAVKIIRPEIIGSGQALARFKREVHLAKQVTHPNVCRIFDLFRHRDGNGDVL